jgi:hypothetical protein
LKHLRNKRPGMVKQEWFLHWDNSPVHTTTIVKTWLAARAIQVLLHPPYLPDLAPADFFLSRKVKEELASVHLTQESLKSTWERVMRTIVRDEFAVAFRQWFQRCEKCICIRDYVKKS